MDVVCALPLDLLVAAAHGQERVAFGREALVDIRRLGLAARIEPRADLLPHCTIIRAERLQLLLAPLLLGLGKHPQPLRLLQRLLLPPPALRLLARTLTRELAPPALLLRGEGRLHRRAQRCRGGGERAHGLPQLCLRLFERLAHGLGAGSHLLPRRRVPCEGVVRDAREELTGLVALSPGIHQLNVRVQLRGQYAIGGRGWLPAHHTRLGRFAYRRHVHHRLHGGGQLGVGSGGRRDHARHFGAYKAHAGRVVALWVGSRRDALEIRQFCIHRVRARLRRALLRHQRLLQTEQPRPPSLHRLHRNRLLVGQLRLVLHHQRSSARLVLEDGPLRQSR